MKQRVVNYFQNLYLCDSQQLIDSLLNDRYVVNYFQNLYLCDCKQQEAKSPVRNISCELLSKFVSLWLQTTSLRIQLPFLMLWITFKICTFVIWNNNVFNVYISIIVVNYFQNLYLCDLKQQYNKFTISDLSCELLSKFVSLWFETTV